MLHAERVRPLLWALVLACLACVGLSGPASAQAPPVVQAAPPSQNWVRAAHLLADAVPMRITVAPADGAAGASVDLTERLPYGQSTDYRSLPPGDYAVTVRPAAAAADATPVLSSTYEAAAGASGTLAVLGTADAPRLAVLTDDLTPPGAGQARVRVLPAASGAPQVTVQAAGGPTIVRDAVLGAPTLYASVPAGPWRLTASSSTGRSGSSTVRLAAGAVYTLLVLDEGAGLTVTTLLDAAGMRMSGAGAGAGGAVAGSAMDAPVGGVAAGAGGMSAGAGDRSAGISAGAPGGRRTPVALVPLTALMGAVVAAVALTTSRRRRFDHPIQRLLFGHAGVSNSNRWTS